MQVICKNVFMPRAVRTKHVETCSATARLQSAPWPRPPLGYMWALVLLSRSYCCGLYCFWECIFASLVSFSIFIFCLAFFSLCTKYNCLLKNSMQQPQVTSQVYFLFVCLFRAFLSCDLKSKFANNTKRANPLSGCQ